MRFPKYSSFLPSKTHRSIHLHTTVSMRFRLSTLKRLKVIELHFVTYDELFAHATNRGAGVRFHFHAFRPSTLIRHVCVLFWSTFKKFFDLNARRISVEAKGLNASKCMRFQTKTHYCRWDLKENGISYQSFAPIREKACKCIWRPSSFLNPFPLPFGYVFVMWH